MCVPTVCLMINDVYEWQIKMRTDSKTFYKKRKIYSNESEGV